METELFSWFYLKKVLRISTTTLYPLLLIQFLVFPCEGQVAFRTTWKTDNPGTSGNTEITIPTFSGEVYNYDVDWDNNGTWDELGITGDVTHDFGSAGYKTIRIRGDFPRIYFNDGGDALKLINILEWGDIEWSSMESAFNACRNMTCTATDSPDLSGVTSLSKMFRACDNLEGDFSDWETGTITDMSELFYGADLFNSDIGNWDVSNVTNMTYLFAWAFAFNQDLSAWDVSNVMNMNLIFNDATAFDQSLGDWTLNSSVTLSSMLSDCGMSCENYDLTLKGWYHNPATPDNRSLGASGLNYWNSQWEHHQFENDRGWNISGDNFSNCSYGPADGFITTWKTDNVGTTGDNQLFIPTFGTGYDFAVDWENDGVLDQFDLTGTYTTHLFHPAGTIHCPSCWRISKDLFQWRWGLQEINRYRPVGQY
jgi:surface protein